MSWNSIGSNLFGAARSSTPQPFNNSKVSSVNATTALLAQPNGKEYKGGTISVDVFATDTQRKVIERALKAHAIAAGLSDNANPATGKSAADEFAERWAGDGIYTQKNGRDRKISDAEFADTIKAKGKFEMTLAPGHDNGALADLNRRVAEQNPGASLTPEEQAGVQQQNSKGASQSQATVQEKPVLTIIENPGNKQLDARGALDKYIRQRFDPTNRVWGDEMNKLLDQAERQGVKIENLQQGEDGNATFNISAADKAKVEKLFNESLGNTIKGEQASRKGQEEATNQVVDTGKMYVNGAINTINGITEPVRGVLETAGVDTSAAKLPKLEYNSEIGKKYGAAGEIGTQIGIVAVTAPALLKTAAGKVVTGASGVYNVAAGAAGVDPTEKGETTRYREMSALERGLRVAGGALEIVGARPTFGEAGAAASKTAGQTDEVIEALTPDGQVVRAQVPKPEVTGGKGSNVLEARLPDMDEQINAVPKREKWRDLYGEGAETDAMNTVNKTGAGMAAKPQHHVFPQQYRKFFEERGFVGERSIDNFVVTLDQSDHQAIHGVNFKLAQKVWKDGEWNSMVIRNLKAREQEIGRKLTFEEVKVRVEDMMERYGIPKDYQKYRGGVK